MEEKKENNLKNVPEEINSDENNIDNHNKISIQIKESSKNIIKGSNKTISLNNTSEFPIENENNEDFTIKTEKELIKNKNNINSDINSDKDNNKIVEKERIKDLYEIKKLKEKNIIPQKTKKEKDKKHCCKSCYYFCGCNKKDRCNIFCRYCCDNLYRNCKFF